MINLMIKNIFKLKNVKIFLWFFALFSYFFQFPFSGLAKFIIPFLGVFLIFELQNIKILSNKKYISLFILYLFVIFISAIYSLLDGTSINRILRFGVILIAIPYCTLISEKDFSKYENIFVDLAMCKSFLLIIIAIYLILEGDHSLIRGWALSNHYGDIYLLNSIPKVQVQGNALLVVAFFISFYKNIHSLKPKYYFFDSLLILLGVISAGNFAFILGILLFAFYYVVRFAFKLFQKGKLKIKYLLVIGIISMVVLIPYVHKKIIEKSEHSNKIRLEQVDVLLDTNYLFGNGLGNEIIASTSERNYNGNIYFEMQTLYIFNQIGTVGILLFYIVIIFPFFKYSIESTIFYLIYLCYSFWNPYCFDSTQMFTVILFINLISKGEKNEKGNYYTLSSFKKKYRKCI